MIRFPREDLRDFPDEIAEFLSTTGIPRRVITIFRAVGEVHTTERPFGESRANGVVLGLSREDDELFLDFKQRQVWLLASWREDSPILTNSSLSAFVECLVNVDELYPFYPPKSDLDVSGSAELELREMIETLDPASTQDPDGFWCAFLGDVGVGDYSGLREQ